MPNASKRENVYIQAAPLSKNGTANAKPMAKCREAQRGPTPAPRALEDMGTESGSLQNNPFAPSDSSGWNDANEFAPNVPPRREESLV